MSDLVQQLKFYLHFCGRRLNFSCKESGEVKNKIVICITAKRKSPGKSSRQRDKTREIEAVRFNKRARKGKKGEIVSPVTS